MRDERMGPSRRRLLKLGAAGVPVAGSGKVFPQLAAKPPGGPVRPVVLRSSTLELALDAENGLPSSYRLVRSAIVFRGEDPGTPLKARVCQLSPWSLQMSK